jgi:hypothetical protein
MTVHLAGTGTEGRHASEGAVQPADKNTCMACTHRVADHDAIARRYCNATVERALTRGCICSVPPA